MTDVMTHRGPNDRGTLEAPGVAFGVRRLSIVDVEGGHQPFANEDGGVWAVQNGELYNHVELRAASSATGTASQRCDTEILPHLYEQHGPDVPRAAAGQVRDRGLGRAAAPRRARARPARGQAALLRARSATSSSSPPS